MHRFSCHAIVVLASLAVPTILRAEDAAGHVARAKAHLEKREYDKAIADCDKAIELDIDSAEAYFVRAQAWNEKRECEKAVADCDEALAINPRLFIAHVLRAKAYMDNDDIGKRIADRDKALADCNQALAMDPKSVEAYTTRGQAWIFKHDCDKAIADCDKALELDPKSAEAYSLRGWAWSDKHEYDKAIADCNRAAEIDPKLASAYANRSWAFEDKGDDDKAMADCKRALALDPDDWKTRNHLGVEYWKLAQRQLREAAAAELKGDSETAKACRLKSKALMDAAVAEWIRGIETNPRAVEIHSNLGYAYSEANNLAKAEFHLRKACEVEGISSRAHNNLGRVVLRRSQQFDAEAREAEGKSKTDPAAAAKAKQLDAKAKEKLNEAIQEFEKAVQEDHALLKAWLNLGEVYTQLKDFDKAEAEYRAILRYEEYIKAHLDAMQDYPDAKIDLAHAYFGLARIAIARKQADEADSDLQSALQWNPNNLSALQLLASQLYQRGEYASAEKCLQSWLAKLPLAERQKSAEQLVKELDDSGNHEAAAKARAATKLPAENAPKP